MFGTKSNGSSAEPVECSGAKYFQAVELKALLEYFKIHF